MFLAFREQVVRKFGVKNNKFIDFSYVRWNLYSELGGWMGLMLTFRAGGVVREKKAEA